MLIKVKVFPESKKQEIVKKSENAFLVKIKQKPEKGMVNKKVIELVSLHFGVPANCVRLKKGAKQRNKIFEICQK